MTNTQRLRRCFRVFETSDPLRLVIMYKEHLGTPESKLGKCRHRLAVHVFGGWLTRQHAAWKVCYYLEVVRRRFVYKHVIVQSLNKKHADNADKLSLSLLLILLLLYTERLQRQCHKKCCINNDVETTNDAVILPVLVVYRLNVPPNTL